MGNTALVTGITGQDGSYLAELLLKKGYKVVGLVRRSSVDTTERIRHLVGHPNLELVDGDITDASCMYRLIARLQPHEVYNLAAMSHVGMSFEQPETTFDIDAVGPLNILEAIRQASPHSRFYQASTSELFGDTTESPQSEATRFRPCSPYAVAKLAAHHSVKLYREAYGLFACAGILFNHESPRRGGMFVTRKITGFIGKLMLHLAHHKDQMPMPKLHLGNLDARRDWGHAKDYVRAMWLMLQQEMPGDFVIATGETRTVRQFLEAAFGVVGLDYQDFVVSDPKCLRPSDVNLLCGDASKAQSVLGWEPTTSFEDLVEEMVAEDCLNNHLELKSTIAIANRWREAACPVS